MAFNIAYTYQLIDKYTAPIQKIIAATRAHTRYLKENQDALKISNKLLALMANKVDALTSALNGAASSNAIKHLTDQIKLLNNEMDRLRNPIPPIPPIPPGPNPPPGPGPGPNPPPGPPVPPHRRRLQAFGAAASGLAGIGAARGITDILKKTAAVENAMIDMGRATNLPGEELKKFEERFMSLSEQIGISTDKLAIMAFEGSKTGIDNADLEKYVKLTANAAVSFEILESEAGRALGSIKAKMGLNIDQLTKMMDVTNAVADATSADGERMINILERLSGQFKTLHLSPEVAAGFAGVADQLETSPELAASGMNMMLNKMMKSSALATKMLKAPEDTLRAVMKKFAAMPEAKRIAEINKAFGTEAGRFVIKLAGNMQLFEETMAKAKSKGAMGSMEREMQSKLKSLTMLWNNMRNAVTNVMVAIGEGLAPDIKKFGEYLREVTPKIRDFVREHPDIVKFAAGIALAVAAIALAVPIAWALGAAFGFIGAAIGLISAPLVIAVGLIAGFASRWDEWVKNGHPVPKLISSIADRLGRLKDRFVEIIGSERAGKIVELMGKAFDALGYALVIPLKLLDKYLEVLEWIVGTQDKVKPIGELAGGNISALIPPSIGGALSMDKIIGKNAPQQQAPFSGTITVKAEPGTDAKVSQPSLPTGSNLLMMKKQ